MTFLRVFHAEAIKLKRTLALLGVTLVPFLLVGLNVLVFYFRRETFAAMETNPWAIFFRNVYNVNALLVIPVAIMTLAYLLQLTESRASAWKHLFALPVERSVFYHAKLLVLVLLVALYVALLGVWMFAGGGLLGWLTPEVGFRNYVYADVIGMGLGKLFVASLGIIGIQHLLTALWPDLVRSFGIGLVLLVTAWVLSSWEHAYLVPYAEPVLSIDDVSREDFSWLRPNLLVSALCFVAALFLGTLLVRRRDLSGMPG